MVETVPMFRQWFQRQLGNSSPATDAQAKTGPRSCIQAASCTQAAEQLEAFDTICNATHEKHTKPLQRGLRRMALAQQEQNETLIKLTALVEARDTAHKSVATDRFLEILDDLDRAVRAISDQQLVESILRKTIAALTEVAQLIPITTINSMCPELGVEVVSSIPSDHAPGVICEILQQGYVASDGKQLRPAKVIVSAVPISGAPTENTTP